MDAVLADVHGGATLIQRRHEPVPQVVANRLIFLVRHRAILTRPVHAESEILALEFQSEAVTRGRLVHRIETRDGSIVAVRPVDAAAKMPVVPVVGFPPARIVLHPSDALTRAIECTSHDRALVPREVPVGAEAAIQLADLMLISV